MSRSFTVRLRAEWTRRRAHWSTGKSGARRARKPRVEVMEGRTLLASITEYPIPGGTTTLGNGLYGITGGPDGNVYFTDTLDNAIGQVTPSGVISELPLPTSGGGLFFN